MRLLLCFLLLHFFAAQGTPPAAAPEVLRLGMTRAEVLALLGEPIECYAATAYKHIKDCSIAYRVYEAGVWEVYGRRTAANEYEIRVHYRADITESRLHPKLRLSAVWFVLDRPAPVRVVMDDLQEAQRVCALSCKFWGLSAGKPQIVAFPEKPGDEDVKAASLVAGSEENKWRPAFTLWWEDKRDVALRLRSPGSIDWQTPIEELQLRPFDPRFELEMYSRFPPLHKPPVELGTWQPARR